MKQILFILILAVASAQAQTGAARAEKPKAKLLVSWQAKNCRACQSKMIDGQEFQIISDERVTLAFHGGAGADFLVGDVYILNKTSRPIAFDPAKDVAVSAWTTGARKTGAAETLRLMPDEDALLKAPRPEFWSGVESALGGKKVIEKAENAQPVFLKAGTIRAGESFYGTMYFPKNDSQEAIGFNIAVGDRIYSFSFRNPKNNSSAAK